MHYIIGTEIVITGRSIDKIRPGMTSAQIRQASNRGTKYGDIQKMFEPNDRYILNRIFTRNEKCVYKFSSLRGHVVEAEFNSVSDAENFIAEVRNEQVPDYSATYLNKTD